jgi:hypothetical protein
MHSVQLKLRNRLLLPCHRQLQARPKRAFASARPLSEESVDNKSPSESYHAASLYAHPKKTALSSIVSQQFPRSSVDPKTSTATPPSSSIEVSESMSSHDKDIDLLFESPATLTFIDRECPITSQLHIVTPNEDVPRGVWPIFRMMVSSAP